MPPSPVALILGAGANIGLHSAAAFAKAGYKVAISARKLKDEIDVSGYLNIPADFSDPRSIGKIFAKVKSSFGISPDVVIYNAGAWSVSAPGNPFSISTEQFESDLAVNSSSLFAAAKAAVEGWNEVPGDGSSKNFFYTGNALNAGAQPRFVSLLTLGVGKSASAFLIQNASLAFKEQGYKFYYVDERKADGAGVGSGVDGAAHAEEFIKLAGEKEQLPWLHTFVKGTGYTDFGTLKAEA